MNPDAHRYTWKLTGLVAAIALFAVLPAHADYAFSTIDYPGVDYAAGGYTQLYGIDNDGSAVGTAQLTESSRAFSFRYDVKRQVYTRLPEYAPGGTASFTLAGGINGAGIIVGGETQDSETTEFAFVLNQGAFALLSRPGSTTFVQARGVNARGHISGYALNDSDGTYSGFIYDPARNEWTDVLPSLATIGQGLNDFDQLVGSVYENAGVVCSACQASPYAFLRGRVTAIFTVNGAPTDARGISDTGAITGFLWIDEGNHAVGFVIPAPTSAGFQTVKVPAKEFVRFPGAAQTFPEGIANDGTLAGFWTDAAGANHAFIATPGAQQDNQ